VVAALQACATGPDADKVTAACEALNNFADQDNKAALVADGALPALLAAQRAHAGHAGVNEYFLGALYAITAAAGPQRAHTKAAVEACGALAVARALMQQFPADSHIQDYGKWLLAEFA
jgi:hypothetical protein